MDEKEIRQQIETLREQLHYHNYLYHTLDAPVISDYDYDQLYKRLKELESAHAMRASRATLGTTSSGMAGSGTR